METDSLKIGLYLMSARGLAVLKALLREHGPAKIAYVVTASDPSMAADYQKELNAAVKEAGVQCYDRKSIPSKLPAVAARFAAAWRWLLPEDGRPLVVFHDSLLPRYR